VCITELELNVNVDALDGELGLGLTTVESKDVMQSMDL